MPWRLFITLLLCTILIVFVGLNLDNRASISFGFYVFHEVPVFVSMFVSFVCGALVILPFTFGRKGKKKVKKEKDAKKAASPDSAQITEGYPEDQAASQKGKSWFSKKPGKKKSSDETSF
ncbi:MAG: hypothetical protein JXB03_10445 [Spirochaetales bacterium]|nr:hypothetical protein [Spirochaetales bacterium]